MATPFDDPVHLDVIEGWRASDGTHMAAIRLTLDPGWKTYWRAPGDAGIPPSFEWNGSQNLRGVQFHWPMPEVFHDNGMRSIGYSEQVVIPVQITPQTTGADVRVSGQIHIGVCDEICMPMSLDFDAILPPAGARDGTITAALLDRPMTSREGNVGAVTCRFDPMDDGLGLTATIEMPSTGRGEEAVIEVGDPKIWVSEPQTSRSGNMLTATSVLINLDQAAFAVDRSNVRISVFGGNQMVDIRGCTGG